MLRQCRGLVLAWAREPSETGHFRGCAVGRYLYRSAAAADLRAVTYNTYFVTTVGAAVVDVSTSGGEYSQADRKADVLKAIDAIDAICPM